ncbi:glycine betaine ABC transporter substrate-binding protein [Trueperella pecoris]|uniref:glycine betaine ABC transporter substrate-binding protein n=1 Tax=Trueperella pecoris TaxID=2733571 RepID=UPI0018D42699|nr:glycine betaine ABC transporter substrate-binding protein [Trueperella pecoris]
MVTRAFSEENGITSLADLAGYAGKLSVGGNSEFENRPNGPKGLKKFYDVEVGFTPIEDKGGPLTIKALKDGEIQLANIFSASPVIEMNDLVVLGDPKGMFLSSHVAPLA